MVKDKLAVRENFDDDDDEDDLSDDVDDEVFVRDGRKSSLKMEKNKCDERPLMPMRRKSKARSNGSAPEVRSRQPCNIYNCLLPVYFAVAAIISIGFLMLLYIFLVDKLPLLVGKLHWWSSSANSFHTIIAPCSNYKLETVWTTNIPAAISDSQIELVDDIDRDNVSDIIVGVSAKCSHATRIRGNFQLCNGGVVAISGKIGSILWRQQLPSAVLSVQCRLEINGDGVSDCVLTGEDGLLAMLDGADGKILWPSTFYKEPSDSVYNVLVIHDVNDDGYLDILASHYSDDVDVAKRKSEIVIISGVDGHQIAKRNVFEAILTTPQILMDADGFEVVCFVTGGLKGKGNIYVIALHDLILNDEEKVKSLYQFDSGILAAPSMIDANLDGIFDLVFTTSDSVFILDGSRLRPLWNVSLQSYVDPKYRITSVSSPTAAYFNDDSIPDLLITFVVGSSYPNWYYSLIVVLDGKTGSPLLNEPIIRSGIADTVGGISLSFDGFGNDAFIYWTSSCQNHTHSKEPFIFDHNVNDLRFVDLCHLRFNASTRLELFALNQHVQPPGVLLLREESRRDDSLKNIEDLESDQSSDWLLERLIDPARNTIDEKGDQNTNDVEWENTQKLRNPRTLNANSPSVSNLKTMTYETEEDDREDARVRSSHIQVDKILPKATASAVLTKSMDGIHLDLIVSYYQTPPSSRGCITTDQRRRCPHKVDDSRGHDTYSHVENLDLKQAILSTVFISRYRLLCNCQMLRKENMETCARMLPYEMQSYPAHKGRYGNAAYLKRDSLS